MKRKIPPAAFGFYVGLGVTRSFRDVAKKYCVSRAAVCRIAAKESWTAKVEEIERRERESATEKSVESLAAVRERHLKTMRLIQHHALSALQSLRLDSAMNCVKALDLSVAAERLILGEPTERTVVDQTASVVLMHEHEASLRKLNREQRSLLRRLLDSAASEVDSSAPSEMTKDAENGPPSPT